MSRFPSILAVVLAVGCSAPARADWLLYSDQTPGSLPYQAVIDKWAQDVSQTLVVKTDPNEFSSSLSGSSWNKVFVVRRHAGSEPGFADALRTYVNGGKRAEMFLWHDNGTSPLARTAVMSTAAIVMWQNGRTTTGYGNERANVDTVTTSGLTFPSFTGVQLNTPEVIVAVPEAEAASMSAQQLVSALIGLLQTVTCKSVCLTNWKAAVKSCDNVVQTEQCYALYFPGSPDEFTTCIDIANQHKSGCYKSALTTYKNCVKLCDQQQQ